MKSSALMEAVREKLDGSAPPAASHEEVAEAEQQLGFALHPLLRSLYTSVANGGWGPEYDAPGLIAGARPDSPTDGAVAWYRAMRQPDPDDPSWPGWPTALLPVAHWGCAIWSCVDCTTEEGQVVRFDPNVAGTFPHDPWRGVWLPESPSLAGWLDDWLNDRLPFELPPSTIERPWSRP